MEVMFVSWCVCMYIATFGYPCLVFDLVSSPSTPGAYVFQDPSDRDQFQEEVQEKPVVDDRMKRLMGKLDTFLGK